MELIFSVHPPGYQISPWLSIDFYFWRPWLSVDPFTYKLIPWLSGRLNFSIDLLVILVMSVHFMINALDYQCIYLTSASKLLNFLAIPLIISGFPWLSFDPLSHPTGFYWSVLSLNSVYPTNVFPSLSSLNHEGEGPLLIWSPVAIDAWDIESKCSEFFLSVDFPGYQG